MASERPDKKEKKEKKEKRTEESGVKKEKKEKKDKKEKKEKLAAALDEKLQQDVAGQISPEDSDMEEDKAPEAALERKVVPFAVPLADEKGQKKICKTIRKGKNLSHERTPFWCFLFNQMSLHLLTTNS